MSSLFVRVTVTSGRLATGPMAMTATTGCLGPGCSLPRLVFYGPLVTGAGPIASTSGTQATGVRGSASMVALTMVSDTPAWATRADIGTAATSFTTGTSTTLTRL